MGFAATPAFAGEDEAAGVDADAVHVPQAMGEGGSYAESGIGPILPFTTVAQTPHLSGETASGHGCWRTSNAELRATKAKVTVRLQMHNGVTWVTKKTSEKMVYQGCGGGKDAVAKVGCKSITKKRSWRTQVDVNVVGYVDDPLKFTKSADIYCTA